MSLIYYCYHCTRTIQPVEGSARFCPYCAKYLDKERQFCRQCGSESTPNRRGADACLRCGESDLAVGVGHCVLNLGGLQKAFGICIALGSLYLWESRNPGWLTTLSRALDGLMKHHKPLPSDSPLFSFVGLVAQVGAGVLLLALLGPLVLQLFTRGRVQASVFGLQSIYLAERVDLDMASWLRAVRRSRLNPRRFTLVVVGRSRAALKRGREALKRSWEEVQTAK
ncbi:hypothetical protein [Armatimonas sp.]|uniref:hypothetical protein n=1 Tax=Armatimonas sp. TaxID=1872638 RepID=UPI003753B717